MKKIGLIGAGKMGISHLAILGAHPDVQVVGVADTSTIVTDVLKRHTSFDVYSDYQDMINEKKPDAEDFAVIEKAHRQLGELDSQTLCSYPMMFVGGENWGDIYRTGYHFGVTHTHHFYSDRNLLIIARLWQIIRNTHLKWVITSVLNYLNKKQSYTGG